MAANIKDFEISKTFSNVLLSNVDGQSDEDGVPYDLSTISRQIQGQVQDAKGYSIPLHLSQSEIWCSQTPQASLSLVRKQEILEGITYFQTASLIYG